MLVDPEISRRKFEREVDEVRAQSDMLERRGAFLLRAEHPQALVLFGTPNSTPFNFVAFAVMFDFTDYDLKPPSVRFVNPYTKQLAPLPELLLTGPRRAGASPGGRTEELMVQCHPGGKPFLCLAGVREFHDSSAHSGDSWWLHRGGVEGKLFTLIDVLCTYGAQPVTGLNLNFGLARTNLPS